MFHSHKEEPGYLTGIALGYGLDDRVFVSRQGVVIYIITASRPVLGPTQPPIQWVPRALLLGLKWPGREADHSPPPNAEVKDAWSCTSIPQHAFMAWCSVKEKHRGNFTFTLLT
jgi:hypothetical protein